MRATRLAPLWLAILLATVTTATATPGWWVSYLDANDIRQIALTDDGLWCATGGGALFYDFGDGSFRGWNRQADGLASDTLTAVAVFPDGKIAFGTAAAGVSLYEPSAGLWFNYTALTWPIAGDEIRFIHESPPWRIIGSQGGFVALEDGEVATPCQQGLDLCGLTGWDVRAGIRHDDALWLASSPDGGDVGGVARYRADVGWDTVSTGLPSFEVTDFATWDGQLFCATVAGVVVRVGESWELRRDGIPERARVMDLWAGSTRLLAAATWDSGGVFEYLPDAQRWQRLGAQLLRAHTVAEDADGIVWAGMSATRSGRTWLTSSEDGLWEFVGGQWLQHRRDGPHPVASYRALAVDAGGRVWAAAQGAGVSWRLVRCDENGWSTLNSSNSGLNDDWVFDLRFVGDRVWVGHCCCTSPPSCPFDILDPSDGTVTTVDSVGNIWDSDSDARGNVWVASFREQAGEQGAAGVFQWNRASGLWSHYDTETTGGLLRSNRVPAVAVRGDELWIGYDGEGLSVVEMDASGGLPLESAAWRHYSADSGNALPSSSITALAAHGDEIWIGTNGGVSLRSGDRWRIFSPSPYGLPGGDVRDLCVTDDGAAWIGVWGRGVTRISRDGTGNFVFDRFGPPDLVNPDVWAVATGAEGRDVWVATNHGLSHFIPGPRAGEMTGDEIHVYPNPFNPACGEPLRFAALPGRAVAGLVVDVSGRVLARFREKWAGESFWDGRDLGGERVAPGLYIVRASTPRGHLTGRIAVVDLPCDGW